MASDLNYTTYISQIANLTAISSNDVNFQTMTPGMIDYAEQRVYREGDFLATYITDTSTNVVANQRTFNYPTSAGSFLVIDQINIITPISAGSSNGTRNPLQVTSKMFIDMVYPSNSSGTGVPKFFAPATATRAILGPVPDQAYNVEVIGTQRPAALSASNSSTFLTQTLPDLFIAASMIFASGYMRNFGAQADNPQTAVSWDSQYDKLFASANMEEMRKKYVAPAWQAQVPSPAQPPRV
jgi:hypothetical protein